MDTVTTFARQPQKRSIALTALETRENVGSAMFTITASVYCSLEKTLNPVCRGENCKQEVVKTAHPRYVITKFTNRLFRVALPRFPADPYLLTIVTFNTRYNKLFIDQ